MNIFEKLRSGADVDMATPEYAVAIQHMTECNNMINIYKAAGAADVSFHQTGQQTLEFADSTHASGWVYLTALMVNGGNARHMYLRYFDKYEKRDGRWWIVERDQYILFSE